MSTTRSKTVPAVTESSGNVFADLGLPNPEKHLAKAHLTFQIFRLIQEKGLTEAQTVKALRLKPPQAALLMKNRSANLAVGKLIELLTALGQDVEIHVRPTRHEHGELSVKAG